MAMHGCSRSVKIDGIDGIVQMWIDGIVQFGMIPAFLMLCSTKQRYYGQGKLMILWGTSKATNRTDLSQVVEISYYHLFSKDVKKAHSTIHSYVYICVKAHGRFLILVLYRCYFHIIADSVILLITLCPFNFTKSALKYLFINPIAHPNNLIDTV